MARESAASMGFCLGLCISLAVGCLTVGLGTGTAAASDGDGSDDGGSNGGGNDGGVGPVFARLDRNRDGVVSFDEMRRARDRWVRRVDTDGDGRISRYEFLNDRPRGGKGPVSPLHRARRTKVFARIDMNGDGHIDAAEREASLKRWFARRDLDGDGRRSDEELRAARKRWLAWRGSEPPEPAQRGGSAPKAKTERKRQRGIARFDRNADGAVSYAELSAARAGRMEAIDLNRDGRVSYDEFVNRLDARGGEGNSSKRSWRVRLFVRIDSDRDGYITPDEHALAMRGWFARMDSDGDGLISAREMEAARARWRARRRALREAE